ncbi:MAG: hypothetical protein RBT43_03230, partial [bacterium]|nr:hypothetical protein [bacterium]
MKHKNVYSFRNVIMIVLAMIMVISCEKSPKPLPKLLDLGADKCIPCKEMAPILEELKLVYGGVGDVEFFVVWNPELLQ